MRFLSFRKTLKVRDFATNSQSLFQYIAMIGVQRDSFVLLYYEETYIQCQHLTFNKCESLLVAFQIDLSALIRKPHYNFLVK